ncbi:MAG: hypothetical protein ABI574_05255 [Burkholderiales bacterium]
MDAGTHVTAGRASAVVVATGMHTEVGRIAGLTERAEEPKTPLELRIEQFGRWLVVAALGLFVLLLGLTTGRSVPVPASADAAAPMASAMNTMTSHPTRPSTCDGFERCDMVVYSRG